MLGGHFIDSSRGRVFLASWRNEKQPNTAVLCLPPLAEELNCSRRAIAVQCQALVQHGMDCFVLDYFGTGDSEGDFADASIAVWEQDASAAIEWIKGLGYERLLLWGLRLGGTLGARVLSSGSPNLIDGLLLWQPVESGARLLKSLMRMRAVKNDVNGSKPSGPAGMDVAGYFLSDLFIEELESLSFADSREALALTRTTYIAIVLRAGASQSLSQGFPEVDCWEEVMYTPFWSIPEAPVNEALTSVTTEQMLMLASTEPLQVESE